MTQLHVSVAMFDAGFAASSIETTSAIRNVQPNNSSDGKSGRGRKIGVNKNQNTSRKIREYNEPRGTEGVVIGRFTDNPALKNWMDTWNREAEQEKLNASEILEYDELGEVVVCTFKDQAGKVSSLVTMAPNDHNWHSFERTVATEEAGRKLHGRILVAIKNGDLPETVMNPLH